MRVLVADDDDFIRELVGIFLEGSGLAMVEAEDGLEAIAEFERQPFRIALIDVMMPKQDGIETIAQVRRRWPSTRIIAMSAGSRLIKRDDALAWASGLGADAVVQKPFDPIMLSDIIERQLALAPPPSQRLAC
ncbi:response regulator [Caulobacter endophyticus]|uniref:Response regulatory domain-containing protein n=1 Tax=Caulobacter endophyticus TaxID=2172652 RepID=A0A2T9KCJ4_9CAUL|nr:response regulator [Caulobacter endophyticus]PVM93687.1 hypothetical protein DDF67_03140 [Caulobacter endophyticus]